MLMEFRSVWVIGNDAVNPIFSTPSYPSSWLTVHGITRGLSIFQGIWFWREAISHVQHLANSNQDYKYRG